MMSSNLQTLPSFSLPFSQFACLPNNLTYIYYLSHFLSKLHLIQRNHNSLPFSFHSFFFQNLPFHLLPFYFYYSHIPSFSSTPLYFLYLFHPNYYSQIFPYSLYSFLYLLFPPLILFIMIFSLLSSLSFLSHLLLNSLVHLLFSLSLSSFIFSSLLFSSFLSFPILILFSLSFP